MAVATLNELYGRLVEQAYTDDLQSQQHYLSLVADMRKIPVDYLLSRGALFIPNNEYIHHYLGAEADAWGPGLYEADFCPWTLFVVLPIQDLVEDTVGLVGWDVQNKYKAMEEGLEGLPMYKVSSKLTFRRENYFLSDIGVLRQQFEHRAIFIVDGVFDSVTLNWRGLPAISLLGSNVSPNILYFLRWYKEVYVIRDNDDAGTKLYNRLRRALPSVHQVLQNKCKDIEEALRPDGFDGPLTQQLWQIIKNRPRDNVFLR